MRSSAAVLWMLAAVGTVGCEQSVWVPGIGLPWTADEGDVDPDRVVDACTVTLHEGLIGVQGGTLWSDAIELATLPRAQALDLARGSLTTLGEIRVPVGDSATAFQFEFGAPGEAETGAGAGAGNATPEQRDRMGGAVLATFEITCETTTSVTVTLPAFTAVCPLPADLEIAPQASFSTRIELDIAAVLATDPDAIEGSPWVAADANGDGTVDASERAGSTPDALINERFLAAVSSDGAACSAGPASTLTP